ncbi:MAG TPA: bifunctional phosphoribosyl-AMP cyclohydrolase/phosphoribosyl-ATP diphosphatase HisIE [Limnochordales bacterium]
MEWSRLRFQTNGLIPVVVQDADSGEVLMMAYMNREALQRTLETGKAWYWSRSRQTLWLKGEESGHYQRVRAILADCDGDALLLKVEQEGPGACHEGYRSCFHYELDRDGEARPTGQPVFDPDTVYGARGQDVFQELYDIIVDRRDHPREGSYTAYLFREGLDKILKKVGEESAEVIIAAKNDTRQPLLEETADLIYHLTVLMAERGITPRQVFQTLRNRRKDAQAAH